jgi:hypothetical protein
VDRHAETANNHRGYVQALGFFGRVVKHLFQSSDVRSVSHRVSRKLRTLPILLATLHCAIEMAGNVGHRVFGQAPNRDCPLGRIHLSTTNAAAQGQG